MTGKTRAAVRARSGGVCERCGAAAATNIHHRKNRSQGGSDDLSNLLHLDGSGTTGCHGDITTHPAKSYTAGWSVRRNQDPTVTGVLYRGRWVYLLNDGSTEWEQGRMTINQDISNSKELTQAEASRIIDVLEEQREQDV